MICPCQGSGKIGGVHCPTCLGSGDPSHRRARQMCVELVGPLDQLAAVKRDPDTRATLHALTAGLDRIKSGEARRIRLIQIIDNWIGLGERGEAACVARDYWRDLPDDVLLRAGAHEEYNARRRMRILGMMPVYVDDTGGFETDEDAEQQVQWGEMPAIGVR